MISIENAKGTIKKYTYSNEYSNIYDFFDAAKVSKIYFNACLNVVKEKDLQLYNKCLAKMKKSRVDNYYKYLEICRDLARGIQTGFFSDNTPFDMLNFYNKLPFSGEKGRHDFIYCIEANPFIVDSKTIFGRINKFTEVADPVINKIIMDFATLKKITRIRIVDEIWLKNKYKGITRFYKKVTESNGNEFIIDRELTLEDIDKVIQYMKKNNFLFLEPIFIIILERYFMEEIKLEDSKSSGLIKKR